jgi:hypothetical protein
MTSTFGDRLGHERTGRIKSLFEGRFRIQFRTSWLTRAGPKPQLVLLLLCESSARVRTLPPVLTPRVRRNGMGHLAVEKLEAAPSRYRRH